MIERLQQRGIDAVRLQFVRDAAEQFGQALARVGDLLDLAEHLAFAVLLPAFQRGLQQRFAGAEMPVETALGHAQLARQGLHGQGADTLFGDQVQGGEFPILRRQAGTFWLAADIHLRMVARPCGFVICTGQGV